MRSRIMYSKEVTSTDLHLFQLETPSTSTVAEWAQIKALHAREYSHK